jgi:hypothetical protein
MNIVKTAMVLALGLALLPGCGGKKKKSADDDEEQLLQAGNLARDPGQAAELPLEPDAPGPPTKPMGADMITAFNYEYGKGSKAYKKAEAAAKKSDWQAVKDAAQAAIAADPWHLDAHRTLAGALARLGEHAAVSEHLSIALAGDWLRWGPVLDQDPALAELWKTEAGSEVRALNQAYRAEFSRRARNGIWLVGRRTRYTRPDKPGTQWSATRGELFAYDQDTRRYVRLTHTGEALAGWMRSPTGDEIAWIAYSQVNRPATGKPLLGRVRVGVIDAQTLLPIGETTALRGDFTRVDLQYRSGDELIASVFEGKTEWDYQPAGRDQPTTRYALDKQTGKPRKVDVPASDESVLSMTLEKVWLTEAATRGYQVSGAALTVAGSPGAVTLPADELVTGVVLSPSKTRLVVSTVADGCSEKPTGSIYLGNVAAGKLEHILRGNSDFQARWIDDSRLVYEDDYGDLRIYDAAERKQVETLKNSAGLGLRGLGATRGILCTGGSAAGRGAGGHGADDTADQGADDEGGDDDFELVE